MSDDVTFGTYVEVSAIVGRLRRWRSRAGGEIFFDHASLDYGHGRRPSHTFFDQTRSERELKRLDVVCEARDQAMRRKYAYPDTLVDLVRVSVGDVRDWTAPLIGSEQDTTPMRGVVIGRTRRHAGRVSSGYDEGNTWTTTGTVPVLTVAVETDRAAVIYDVLPDDVTATQETS